MRKWVQPVWDLIGIYGEVCGGLAAETADSRHVDYCWTSGEHVRFVDHS